MGRPGEEARPGRQPRSAGPAQHKGRTGQDRRTEVGVGVQGIPLVALEGHRGGWAGGAALSAPSDPQLRCHLEDGLLEPEGGQQNWCRTLSSLPRNGERARKKRDRGRESQGTALGKFSLKSAFVLKSTNAVGCL